MILGDPRLPALRRAGTAPGVLPGGSRVARRAQLLVRRAQSTTRCRRREPRARRLRDISQHLRASAAAVDRYERIFAAVAPAASDRGDGGRRMDGRTRAEPVVHVSGDVEATRADVAAWARANRVDERRLDRAESRARRRPATRARAPACPDATRYPGPSSRLSTFEIIPDSWSSRARFPRCSSRTALASLAHARRADRAGPPGPRDPRADAGALGTQPRARRDARPDPRDLQRAEEASDARRPLPVDRHRPSARSLGFQTVVLSLYDRERNVFAPSGALSASTGGVSELQRREGRGARRSRSTGTTATASRSRTTSGAAAIGERRRSRGAAAARVLGGRRRTHGGRARLLWIPLVLRRTASSDACASEDPKNGLSPSLETIRVARDLRQPGRRRDRDRALLHRGARAERSATR